MKDGSDIKTGKIALTGLMSAAVFVSSMISIPVGSSRIHLGNSMILLAGFLLGGTPGGFAGGIGSLLYDACIYGADPAGCLVTFFSKFAMGFTAGKICAADDGKVSSKKLIISGICGEAAYIVLYLGRKFVFYKFISGTSLKAALAATGAAFAASLFNAAAAVVISVILYRALYPALKRIQK